MSETGIRLFGACLSDLLARHNLSAAAVSRMMGHKSRTTLRRILQDQANAESMEKFLSEFLEARLLPLTPQEEQELRLALDISRTGLSAYRARAEMRRLLDIARGAEEPGSIRIIEPGSGKAYPAEELIDSLACAKSVKLLIFNAVPTSFVRLLAGFLTGRSDIPAEINHFLFMSGDAAHTVRFISSLFPLIGLAGYRAHAIKEPSPGQSWSNLMTIPLIVISAELTGGCSAEYQLAFTAPDECGLVSVEPQAGIYSFWQSIVDPLLKTASLITSVCPAIGRLPADLIRRTEAYRALEANHAIYMIKPGLLTALIPPDIFKRSVHADCLSEISQLSTIHEKRFSNIFSKKRVTHILTPLSGIRTFMETGLLPDHPPAMRPFTADERREILLNCRNQARDNPYFNIYFLKNELADLNFEIACFDPVGVLLHSGSDHRPQSDILITLNEFTGLFSRFFRETLLTHYALTSSASVAVLNTLIEELSAG